jgi:hypothetical protein
MSMPNVTVGKNLQTSSVVTFGVAPSAAIDITLTSSDPSKVIVSNALTSGGTGSATVHVNASSTTSVGFFIQGLVDSGTVTLTAKAAGYVDTTSTVTLAPSGIIVRNGTLATLNTTASSPDSTLTVAPAYSIRRRRPLWEPKASAAVSVRNPSSSRIPARVSEH